MNITLGKSNKVKTCPSDSNDFIWCDNAGVTATKATKWKLFYQICIDTT